MRTLCVVTTSRADYGLLRWLLEDLRAEPGVKLQLVVTGSHLSPAHGMTVDAILADGFEIDDRIEMMLSADTPAAVAKATGLGVMLFAESFRRLRPDLVVGLGDRYELFAAASAAMLSNIPIAHLHGGESTEGAVDESIRHCLTKMSHIHLVAAEAFRDRVLQMGEDPEHVHVVGAFGVDAIERLPVLDRAAVYRELDLELGRPVVLVTLHPTTLDPGSIDAQMDALESALAPMPDLQVVWTLPNADAEGIRLRSRIEAFARNSGGRVRCPNNLGMLRYLSLARQVDAVMGNSSSGLIEVPSLGVPTINIGDRQKGRPLAESVISCGFDPGEICSALDTAMSRSFRSRLGAVRNPYGGPGAARKSAALLAKYPLGGILRKSFHAHGGGS